jgi:hypothetical protein
VRTLISSDIHNRAGGNVRTMRGCGCVNKTKPLRILHVLPGLFAYGGTPIKLLNLVRYSDPMRIQHAFLLFNTQEENLVDENLANEYHKAGAIVCEVKRRRSYDFRLIGDISRICGQFKCDIINTHFARADIYGVVAGKLCNRPVIKSVHGIRWSNSPGFSECGL